MKQGRMASTGGAALLALALMLVPAIAATSQQKPKKKVTAPSLIVGGFTPAAADPRLAAAFAARGFDAGNFRFTPSSASQGSSKSVKVAVRARASTAAEAMRGGAESSAALNGLTPTAYNLGVAVGWKRFALSGDVAKVDGGILPDGREAAGVGISYAGNRFTGGVRVGAERSDRHQPQAIVQDDSYSLDVGGSYSIARNLAVTGGVRYKIQNDRLLPLSDERRDSQAVYIGTAFRF